MTALPRPRPSPVVLEGRYARLEPLSLAHADALYRVAMADPERFGFLFDVPPANLADMRAWIERGSRARITFFIP
jgi:hypothetical protein